MLDAFTKSAGLFSKPPKPGVLSRMANAVKPKGLARLAVLSALPVGIGAYGLGRGFSRGAADARKAEDEDARRKALAAGYA